MDKKQNYTRPNVKSSSVLQTPMLTDMFIVLSFKPALEKENASQIQGKSLEKKFETTSSEMNVERVSHICPDFMGSWKNFIEIVSYDCFE